MPETVKLFGYDIPVTEYAKTREVRFVDEQRLKGKRTDSVEFMLDFVAVTINARCKPGKPVKASDFDDHDFDFDAIEGGIERLMAPVIAYSQKKAGGSGNVTAETSTGGDTTPS